MENIYRLYLASIAFIILCGCASTKPAIITAAGVGDINTLKTLQTEGRNINEVDNDSTTALMHAIWNGKTNAAKHLIESGADIKTKDKNGYDALIYAVDNGNIDIVNTLLGRSANIESKDQAHSTPLNHAVVCGHYDIIELLLTKGANTESKDRANLAPLTHAVLYGRYDIIELLLNKGADIETKDSVGATPLVNAVKNNASEKIIRLLIKKGANLNVKDKEGYTPLAWAFYYERMTLVTEIKKAMTDARKDMPSARIVFVRESNVLMPGEMQDVLVYMDEQVVAKLSRDSTDYFDVSPGKCTIVIKGSKLEGNHIKSLDAIEGKTYYFSVTKRLGGTVAGLTAGVIGVVIESQMMGEEAGPFKITPLEESVAKGKINALPKK